MRALVIGPCGQDGSYLVEQLLEDDHEVYGLVRRFNATTRARQVYGDLRDQESLERCLRSSRPDVVFNLAAVTAPGTGWGAPQPAGLLEVTGVGVVRLLDAMAAAASDARLVHASSSAIYDLPRYGPYGAAKRLAHDAVEGYRGLLQCSNAVMFSHTSPRQDPRFLARRICTAVRQMGPWSTDFAFRNTTAAGWLRLTDLESRRDWGYSPDYMRAFRMVADLDPGDYQIATRETHSVRDLLVAAMAAAGIDWPVGDTGPRAVPDEINPETHPVVPGWKPETSFEDLVRELVDAS